MNDWSGDRSDSGGQGFGGLQVSLRGAVVDCRAGLPGKVLWQPPRQESQLFFFTFPRAEAAVCMLRPWLRCSICGLSFATAVRLHPWRSLALVAYIALSCMQFFLS